MARLVFVVFALVLLVTPSARADFRILSSPGGLVSDYLAAFARVRQSGERVVIDGPCLSACTLVLSTIPRNRICVTPRAVPCAAADGPHGSRLTRPAGDQDRHRLLSRGGARLDQATRRAQAKTHFSSRQ